MVTAISPAAAIVDYARREQIDLIVMGTHGRGGVAHLLMGSVAERVVRTAPCPVLTVRHPEHEFVLPDALVARREGLRCRSISRRALPSADDPRSRVILRDGTVATLRVTAPADHDALRRFFHELSPESRRRRFFTPRRAARRR